MRKPWDAIAVGGASAGGGLAASVAQRALDEGVPLVFQLLIYPMLDDRTACRRGHEGRGRFLWTPGMNLAAWTAYLGRRPAIGMPPPAYAAPARRAELAGLPPAWVGVGELDLFFEENRDYARRLLAAGVACEFDAVPGMYHGADTLADERPPTMAAFRLRMTQALQRAIGDRTGLP